MTERRKGGKTEGRKDGTTEGHGESSIAPLFQSGDIITALGIPHLPEWEYLSDCTFPDHCPTCTSFRKCIGV